MNKITILLGLSIIAASQQAFAVDANANPIFTNRVVFGLGGFYANTDAVIGAEDLNSPLKAELDFDDLGLDESQVAPMAYALLRLGNRWRVELDYTNIESDGSGFVESVDVGGITIPVGATVNSKLNTRFISTRLGFSVVRNETLELGISAGVSAASIEAGVSGAIDGIGSASGDITADVPLPSFGIYGTLALTKKLSIGGRAGLFSIEVGDDSGDLQDFFASIDYFFTKNVGVGFAYKYINIDVEIKEDTYRQLYNIRQSGPVAYLSVGFGS
ncbi:MAG: hypothetical protein KAJ95_02050 [Gammaproteobacteria bacterium]|nr:hypothetical protein [Gammaproteobacteria bacterium]